jgi:hypothetical protein
MSTSTVLPLGPPVPLPASVEVARNAIEVAARALLDIPDAALEKPWAWRHGPEDVRYGFYSLYERLEEEAVEIDSLRLGRALGGRIIQQASAALWSLRGLLLPLDADFDRDPGGGEWTVRQTVGHIISSQASFALRTAFWIESAQRGVQDALRIDAPGMPMVIQEPEAEQGTPDAVWRMLLAEFDTGAGLLAGLDATADLDAPALWSGHPVTARFRMQRWSSHLREHTIQVEKTLALLRRPLSEVERLVRVILEAYGRLEGVCHGMPPSDLAAHAQRVATVAEEARRQAEGVRAAASG